MILSSAIKRVKFKIIDYVNVSLFSLFSLVRSVSADVWGQVGEEAEVSRVASLRSCRGLYLSTLTLSLLLRGRPAIIAAAHGPIRAQLCGVTCIRRGDDSQALCEQKLLIGDKTKQPPLYCWETCSFV